MGYLFSRKAPASHTPLVAVVDGRNINSDSVTVFNVLRHLLGGALVADAVQPLVELELVEDAEALSRRRENLGALGKLVDVVHTKQRQTDVLSGVVLSPLSVITPQISTLKETYLVPVVLSTRSSELPELLAGLRVLRDGDIRGELEHTGRRAVAQRLLVVQHIPHTGGAVLRIAGPRLIDKVLLARRMRAKQRNQPMRPDCLVLEQLDQLVRGRKRARQQARRRGVRAVLAADVRLDARAERAHHRRDVGAHLDEVAHADVPAHGLVLAVQLREARGDLLQPAVLEAADLVAGQDDAAVGAAALGGGGLGPGARVVEAEADGGARPLCAASRGAGHELVHVVGDVAPDAARVLLALVRVKRGHGEDVAVVGLGGALALEELLDVLADGGEVAVFEGD
ncbi:hypothetical protein CCHR01_17828 [Colletotrichum chrysophilum]|uniref:Uncharacterized protein n=1 Tax=Colletotrichum chrysophilum TaxID=1836956 RepID=A0AAD9A1E8_9PEZI|nr:hypothetical protein CCHR01_17828 [Colletotrichum chrysophilum]